QSAIQGSCTILILKSDGLIAARDQMGRLPIVIGKSENGYCAAMESFACQKLGYQPCYNLGPGEIVQVTPEGYTQLSAPGEKMRICAFLWSYYGYPNSNYEGVNVEVMRYHNGEIMARADKEKGIAQDVDYVAGVPDSGLPHAIGYSNASGKPFARPFVKYTPTWPRSFMPDNQKVRNQVAKMKQIPVPELIEDKKLLLVDDSIVRGTQMRETVDFLYESGAKEVHIRSACPPIMYGCKYLNFSSSKSELELITRRTVQELEGDEGQKHLDEYADPATQRGQCMLEAICKKLHFTTLGYQSLEGLMEAIGLEPCKICTYCWTGKE
ncbi:MAG: amidophosphoribosyltransferase, partial [Clostridiales bacterium]|nr:amidophosphoribosyltransferase [Clostridiales bacterium]